MGNSASNANNPNRTHRTDHSASPSHSTYRRDDSISPSPGNPHPSLRTKKKSLELPDFVALTSTPSTISARGRQKAYQPATAIPIPTPPTVRNPFSHYGEYQPPRHRPRNNFPSTVSVPLVQDEFDDLAALDTTIPLAPPSKAQREQQHHQREQQQRQQQQQRSASKQRGRQPPISSRQQQVARMQEIYDRSLDPHHPGPPPSSPVSAPRPTYSREVVRSSIPVLLGEAANQAETQENNLLSPIQEDLSADPVSLTITWKGGGTEVILARAGDDDWKGRQPMVRQSPNSNIWTANVCLRPGAHHVRFLVDGEWRVADDLPAAVDDQGSLANYVAVYGVTPALPNLSSPPAPVSPPPPTRKIVPGQSFWSATSTDGGDDTDDTPPPPIKIHPQNAAAIAYVQARWTNILPLELIEAQKEEEVYLAASAGQFEAQQQQASAGRVVVTGFIPAPNIPAAPGLPRHLDRLIMNSRVGEKPVDRAGTPGSQGSGVGSGQGGGRRRDRENRERERERDRDKERERDRERDREKDRERDRDRDRDRERAGRSRRANIPPPPPPSEDGSAELDIESTYVPMNDGASKSSKNQTDSSSSSAGIGNGTATSTAVTTPHVSVPATPSLSPVQSARKLSILEGHGQSRSLAGRGIHLPPPPPLDRSPISDSRIITIDTSTMPSVTDDASVLPVPSHVVLHHLCTSAIKNGVLAVANTTRYRKKYLTTVYYKPT